MRRRLLCVVVLISALVQGCSRVERPGPAVTSSSVTTTPAASSTTPSSTAVTPADAELEANLLKDVPGGFQLQPDHVFDAGSLDMDNAIRHDGRSGAEAALWGSDFVRGYLRTLVDPFGEEIDLAVYQHADHAGAQLYLERLQGQAPPVEQRLLPTPGLPPGSSGFSFRPTDFGVGRSAVAVVLLRIGPNAVRLSTNGRSEDAVGPGSCRWPWSSCGVWPEPWLFDRAPADAREAALGLARFVV